MSLREVLPELPCPLHTHQDQAQWTSKYGIMQAPGQVIKPRSEYASRRGRPKQVRFPSFRKRFTTAIVTLKILHPTASTASAISSLTSSALRTMELSRRPTCGVIYTRPMSTSTPRSSSPSTTRVKMSMKKPAPMSSASFSRRSTNG